jgi:hypothetical protein
VLVLANVARTSVTVDEPWFQRWGRTVLIEGRFGRTDPIDDSKLPVSVIAALPGLWLDGSSTALDPRLLPPVWTPREAAYIAANRSIYLGRVIGLVFYLGLAALVFHAAHVCIGPAGGLAATVLIAFLPTLIGHAALTTVDAAATCALFAAGWALLRCVETPRAGTAVGLGLAAGVAALVKYSAVDLVPMAGGILLVRLLTADANVGRTALFGRAFAALAAATLIALLVVNAGFGFRESGRPLAAETCRTAGCRTVARALDGLPVPLPAPWLDGLDQVTHRDALKLDGGNVYLLGELTTRGRPAYYLVATLVKTPLPFLALCLFRPWRRSRRYRDLALLVPVVVLFVHLSWFTNTHLGIRFLLPAFPFLAVLAAAHWEPGRTRVVRRVASALVLVYVVEAVLTTPRHLAYFNVLIGPRANAHRVLADSNLDWGQDDFALWAWEDAHAGVPYVVQPGRPVAGRVIVSVNDYVGVWDAGAYAWLRPRPPDALIGDAWLLFDVPAEGG